MLLLLSLAALAATWLLLPGAQRAAAVAKAAAARALSLGNVDSEDGWRGGGGGGGGYSADNLRSTRNVASDFLHANRPHHWTWKCDAAQNRCVRKPLDKRAAQKEGGGVSLLSCQMTCDPPLWPRPTGVYSVGAENEVVEPQLITFEATGWGPEECRWLVAAAERARSRIRALQPPSVGWSAPSESMPERRGGAGARRGVEALRVVIVRRSASDPAPHPPRLTLDTDESYRLGVATALKNSVSDNVGDKDALQARVSASTFFGARHALETLVQLMWWDGASLRMLSNVTLSDAPRFPYRGLMLDTARNFFPLASLRATVDMMAANKLNAFHWHLSDSHSFPFASRALPRMAEDGAYAPTETYSPDDVAALVQYALERGVRVLLEVDAPAHTAAGWRWGPEAGLGTLVLCAEQQPWVELCGQPPCGQLNPDNEHIYSVLGHLYRELMELSRVSDLFHLGGDEVNPECWRRSLPNITTQEDFLERWRVFEERALVQMQKAYSAMAESKLREKKKDAPKAIVWSSHLTSESHLNPSEFVVQVWGASAWREAQALLSRRYRVILSHLDAWYLDCGLGDYRSAGDSPCSTFHTWQRVYEHAPWQDLGVLPTAEARKATGAEAALQAGVLGAEACLWTERTDQQVLDSRLWPRASAFAERLWSDPPSDAFSADARSPMGAGSSWSLLAGWQRAHARLAVQRERMVAWGVRADTMQPAWCTQNPGECW